MPHPLLKNRALDAVPIVREISRLLIPWKGIDDLLCRPLGRGMRCHLEVHDAPSLMRWFHSSTLSRISLLYPNSWRWLLAWSRPENYNCTIFHTRHASHFFGAPCP
jgi:hypothetical protein